MQGCLPHRRAMAEQARVDKAESPICTDDRKAIASPLPHPRPLPKRGGFAQERDHLGLGWHDPEKFECKPADLIEGLPAEDRVMF
jgi:hypothetical protein